MLKNKSTEASRWVSPRLSDQHILRRLAEELKAANHDDILEIVLRLRDSQKSTNSFLRKLVGLMQ